MAKPKKSVPASDWGDTWGFGTNKVGKLYLIDLENMIFEWKGHSQGRHGQKWNAGARCLFKVTDLNKKEYTNLELKGSALTGSHLWAAVRALIIENTPVEKRETFQPYIDGTQTELQF
jgi:hypothetical protein